MARKKPRRPRRGSGSSNPERSRPAHQSAFTYWFLRVEPVIAIVLVALIYFAAKSTEGAAIVGGLGIIGWLAVALGSLGSTIPPRDRTRGGAIDFGKRQNGP